MAKKQQKGLGKGLGALLPTNVEVSDEGVKFVPKDNSQSISNENSMKTPMIRIDEIHFNPYQPRKGFDEQELEDLKNSIIENGIIQPITVSIAPDGYILISGERRVRASKLAGLELVPAHIIEADSDYQKMAFALIENVQRSDLNAMEVAEAYQQLIEECKITQEEVAQRVGKERSTITNSLRLLRLPQRIQDSLRNREISIGHAKVILSLTTPQKMILAWKEIYDKELSVRATEALVRDIEEGRFSSDLDTPSLPKQAKVKPQLPEDLVAVIEDRQNKLRHIFGTQVRIVPKNNKSGKIEIEFYNPDDMERIFDIILESSNN